MKKAHTCLGPEGAALVEYIEYMRDSGVAEHWGPESFLWARGDTTKTEGCVTRENKDAPSPYPASSGTAKTLGEVREHIGDCTLCKLHKGRTNIVFGVGDPNARLVFVGEGPGRDEDLQGEPFVGRAGQLLTDIIEKGMKLKRSDVYIANIVKCRPPDNRDPEEDEIAACEPFLLMQLEAIRPKLICALGKFAAQTLLKTKEPISRLRGNIYDYHGITLIPTFHPAYLLRNPKDKALCWEDIKKLMALYDK